MSNVEISHPFSKFSAQVNQFKLNNFNNNNKFSEIKQRSVSPRILSGSIGSDSVDMSPGSIPQRSSELHSPQNNNNNIAITSPNTRSLSPSSGSPRTMSPLPDHRNQSNGYISDGYQQNFSNSVTAYQTVVPPKKSFCIDALLSKNHQTIGDRSPETNRFLSDDDAIRKYSDDQREYASSPEDNISR